MQVWRRVRVPAGPPLYFWTALAFVAILSCYLSAVACVALPILVSVLLFRLFPALGIVSLLTSVPCSIGFAWSLRPRTGAVRIKGVAVDPAQHPRLEQEIRAAARLVRRPIPDAVFITATPFATSLRRRVLGRKGHPRTLCVGLPLLANLTVGEFRSLIIREFARPNGGFGWLSVWIVRFHQTQFRLFGGTDGDVPRGKRDLDYVFRQGPLSTLLSGTIEHYWKWVHRLICRISQQCELHADEVACRTCGPDILIAALRATRISWFHFPRFSSGLIKPAALLGFRCPLVEGFAQFCLTPARLQEKIVIHDSLNPMNSYPPHQVREERAFRFVRPDVIADETRALAAPAHSLLDGLEDLEMQLTLAIAAKESEGKVLRSSDWPIPCALINVTRWSVAVRVNGHLLGTARIADIPDLLARLDDLASGLRRHPGMLPTTQTRKAIVEILLWSAMSFSMVRHGWRIVAQPGCFFLELARHRVKPDELLKHLKDGNISPVQWSQLCSHWRIAGFPHQPQLYDPRSWSRPRLNSAN